MTAWVNIFLIIGYSRFITITLGAIAVIMGLIKIKGQVFFKKDVSLVTVIGTIMLAVFANFIELGCTIGLPAIYTKVLSLKNIPPLQTYFYIAFYNVMYVLPLATIVIIFAIMLGHIKFTDRFGNIFKLISGILMLLLGILLMFFPGLLIIT